MGLDARKPVFRIRVRFPTKQNSDRQSVQFRSTFQPASYRIWPSTWKICLLGVGPSKTQTGNLYKLDLPSNLLPIVYGPRGNLSSGYTLDPPSNLLPILYGPGREKTCLRDFRQSKIDSDKHYYLYKLDPPSYLLPILYGPRHQKTCLQGFRPSKTQTGYPYK